MDFSFLEGSASEVAPLLLGCMLERQLDGQIVRVRIVETESYDQTDAASHSYKGKTPRTDVMFGPAGHLYVYFTYGMHYCCNVTVGSEGIGAAVLIRAVEPLKGEDLLSFYRSGKQGVEISNGPAKLCKALAINKAMNGHNLRQAPLKLVSQPPLLEDQLITTTRIGVSQAKDKPWRFYIKDSPYVSRY